MTILTRGQLVRPRQLKLEEFPMARVATPLTQILLGDASGSNAQEWLPERIENGHRVPAQTKAGLFSAIGNTLCVRTVGLCTKNTAYLDRIYTLYMTYSGDFPSIVRMEAAGWPRNLVQSATNGAWSRPYAAGNTPTAEAVHITCDLLQRLFADENYRTRFAQSGPPLIVHFTDGEPNDAATAAGNDTRDAVRRLWSLRTPRGHAPLLFNFHAGDGPAASNEYPVRCPGRDVFSRLMFDCSSYLPVSMIRVARGLRIDGTSDYKYPGLRDEAGHVGLILNGLPEMLIDLLKVGTLTN